LAVPRPEAIKPKAKNQINHTASTNQAEKICFPGFFLRSFSAFSAAKDKRSRLVFKPASFSYRKDVVVF